MHLALRLVFPSLVAAFRYDRFRLPSVLWLLGLLVLASLAGCRTVAKIEAPAKGNHDAPVPSFVVRFDPDYKPGTFQAFLNGVPITGRFQPTPSPGGVSTASSDFLDANLYPHVLHVQGEFATPQAGIPTRSTHDEVQFGAPIAIIYRGNTQQQNLNVAERQTITATVVLPTAPSAPVTVRVTTRGGTAVSLNNAPAGAPILVVVPTNDRRADFTIRGIQAGAIFSVWPEANGYAVKGSSGQVLASP